MSTPSNPLVGTQPQQLPSPQQMQAQQQAQNPMAQPPDNVQAPVNLPQQNPSVPQTQQPNVQEAHHNLLGRAFYAIADPQPGTGSPTQRLFKNILAGAMIGAANGGHSGSGWGAASNGMRAEQNQEQQNMLLQRQQEQQQFENDLRMKQEQRAQQGFETQQQLIKAQLAEANTQTLRLNHLIQGEDFDTHERMARSGLLNVQPYKDAGMMPVVDQLSESDLPQYIRDHPGASSLDWEMTGVKKGIDANGQPTFEGTYTAYDPKGKLIVSPGTREQWEKDGLLERFPEYKQILEKGQMIPVQAFISMKRNDDVLRADNLQRQKDDLGIKAIQSEIDKNSAERARSLVETNKIRNDIKEAALGKNQQQAFENALQELNKVGGDFNKLQPSSRVVLAESMNKMVPSLTALYKEQVSSMDPEMQQAAGDTLKQIQNLTSLGQRAMAGATNPASQAPATSIPPGAMIAKNPQTGERRYSTDGGKTWVPVAADATSPDDRVLVKSPDGGTGVMTRAEFEKAKQSPPPGMSSAQIGEIVGLAPPPKTDEQTMAGLNLTAGNSR